jgi:hypothetical protein
MSRVTNRVTGRPGTGSRQSSASVPPFAADAKRENQMKRFVLLTALLTFIAGTFAAMVPASADPHGDRFRQDCKSGARKC